MLYCWKFDERKGFLLDLNTVLVIGAGQMGSGIAQVAREAGASVFVYDVSEAALEKGKKAIEKNLNRKAEKGKITPNDAQHLLKTIRFSTSLKEGAEQANLVIEAAPENMDVKKELFRRLDELAPSEAILATNTSSLPITEIAAVTKRPEKVIGMHFMNPVPVMKLIEIIRGLATADEVYQSVRTAAEKMGKVPVEVNDFPGFASNRILMPMINEAIYAVYEGVAAPEDIDRVMKLGMNHPMGPLTLADFIGLDTCLYIMETLHEGFGDDKYRPCPLLRKYVRAGWLGKKTGKGFYDYETRS